LVLLPQRVLDVCWKSDEEIGEGFYVSRIRVVVKNQAGSLADVTNIIAKKQVSISNIKTTNRSVEFLEVVIDLDVHNLDHLEEILSELRISKKIIEVDRE
jgi:guanosine-3',5'-bis(diphosphate) 3'-pyrophosphohydrolase